MTVSGIDPKNSAQTAPQTSLRAQATKSVADLLGMSQDDVRSALRAGQSLSDLAQAEDVSNDHLVSTIGQALQAAGVGQAGATDGTASDLAQRIADHKGMPHHRHHHHHQAASASPRQPAQADTSGGTTFNAYA